MRHIFITQDYTPDLGGMARRHVELCRRFPADSLVSTVYAPGMVAADAAEPVPVHRQPFTFAQAGRFANQVRWARWLRREAATFDVVHCGNIRPCGYAAWWASRRAGVPYLVYVNGGDLLRERKKASQPLKRMTARHILGDAAGIIANSAWTGELARDVMREMGVSPLPPVADFPLGTDPLQFAPGQATGDVRARLGLGVAPYLLTVARLVPHKGQDVAIRALARLASELPTLRYVIVGEGPDEPRLRALARTEGVEDRVVFAGALRDDVLPAVYAGAALYVGLSRLLPPINVEGFGISFVEAAASGVPSVAGDSGGVRSAVLDAETGVLVPPEEPERVADAIRTLMVDEPLRRRLGAAAREAALQRFNWDRVARDTVEFAALCVDRARSRS
ncbi:MAG: glycosyltransferase family 4 protein [Gemmatimonadetes bacterium]|nr:glycosyltransferase family 4 protein [Gemmatimonadota bacterium]